MPLTVSEFVQRWKRNTLAERGAAQSHFIDLCEMLGEPHPAAVDAEGDTFTFEKHVSKTSGGKGFADVWKRGYFAWEYKGKYKDLKAAYRQLNDYREDLGNPPLLVVCDLDRFEIHTNFENTRPRVYAFNLDDLNKNQVTLNCPLPPLEVLRALFDDYNVLRPDRTDARVTQDAAKIFALLAERLEIEKRANTDSPIYTKEQIAHFLMRLLFCLFADSIGLLPSHLFRNLIQSQDRFLPKKFLRKLKLLFAAMSEPDSIFGEHSIKYFNGGLFDSDSVIELDVADLGILYEVSKNYNWAHIAPEIFGTLFERSLNKERRSLIGAHYTSAEDILLLIEPVLMDPLKRRWAAVRDSILVLRESERAAESNEDPPGAPLVTAPPSRVGSISARKQKGGPHGQTSLRTTERESERILGAWIDELTSVRVLDPACGSGNFLYLALRRMLDLWKEATDFAVEQGISLVLPKMVSPSQLYGIEIEFYAHELASIVVWIGFLQWKYEHAVQDDREPILQKLDNIREGDAVMTYLDRQPHEPVWPEAEFILGNPPFLGDKRMRNELNVGEHPNYVDDLRTLYKDRVPGGADLVTYWFEKAREIVSEKPAVRVGLVATQSIRGGANRTVLSAIAKTATIFYAWSDRDWTLDGAAVHISLIAFTGETVSESRLNGNQVARIFPNLRGDVEVSSAAVLVENYGLSFIGDQKGGKFNLSSGEASSLLAQPLNPNGRSNDEVIRRWMNGSDITGRDRRLYIIDFGIEMSEQEAALFEGPFEIVKRLVLPVRKENRRAVRKAKWWLHHEPMPAMRKAVGRYNRQILTPRVSKHRLFTWVSSGVLADSAVVAIARDDDYFFGVLHSKIHELWARSQGTQVRDVESGFRYTPNSTFETFPFPWPPGTEPAEEVDTQVKAIAMAARQLVRLRDAWLNPPGVSEADLKDRTLTNLYNKRPEWLANAHRTLDTAVFSAYGWPVTLTDQEILARLLALNHERAAAQAPKKRTVSSPDSSAQS